jgi:hypothetical protein
MFRTTLEQKQARATQIMAELAISTTIENCEREKTHCPNCQPGSLNCRLNQEVNICNQQDIDRAWIEFQETNQY